MTGRPSTRLSLTTQGSTRSQKQCVVCGVGVAVVVPPLCCFCRCCCSCCPRCCCPPCSIAFKVTQTCCNETTSTRFFSPTPPSQGDVREGGGTARGARHQLFAKSCWGDGGVDNADHVTNGQRFARSLRWHTSCRFARIEWRVGVDHRERATER